MDDTRMRGSRWSVDPVVVGGTVLTIGLGVAFYLTQNLAPAFATFGALLGLIVTLQIQILVRDRRRAWSESRMANLVTMTESIPWMPDLAESILRSTTEVEQKYPETFAVEVCRFHVERCRSRLADLEQGRFHFPCTDNSLNVRLCEELDREMLAVSFPAQNRDWWDHPDHQEYWARQMEALRKGKSIRRIFIYDLWTQRIDEIAHEQATAGVEVKKVNRARVPENLQLVSNVWDDACAMTVAYNASGDAVRFQYTVESADIRRTRQNFERLSLLAVHLDEEEPPLPAAGPAVEEAEAVGDPV